MQKLKALKDFMGSEPYAEINSVLEAQKSALYRYACSGKDAAGQELSKDARINMLERIDALSFAQSLYGFFLEQYQTTQGEKDE